MRQEVKTENTAGESKRDLFNALSFRDVRGPHGASFSFSLYGVGAEWERDVVGVAEKIGVKSTVFVRMVCSTYARRGVFFLATATKELVFN